MSDKTQFVICGSEDEFWEYLKKTKRGPVDTRHFTHYHQIQGMARGSIQVVLYGEWHTHLLMTYLDEISEIWGEPEVYEAQPKGPQKEG